MACLRVATTRALFSGCCWLQNHKDGMSTIVVVEDPMRDTKNGAGEKFLSQLSRVPVTLAWMCGRSHQQLCPTASGGLHGVFRRAERRAVVDTHLRIDSTRDGRQGYPGRIQKRHGHVFLVIVLHGNHRYMLRNTDMVRMFDIGGAAHEQAEYDTYHGDDDDD